jgi:trans-2,3-dihydro-3-hydroxyanthranilate isomerase
VTLRYLHYDVFTTTPLAGNALAVFLDGRGLDEGTMQRIAREMNVSESTFILPAERADTDARMRIFTPAVEMPMAGHPTVGSTFALAESGTIAAGRERFVFGLNVGPTPVDLEWAGGAPRFVWMTQGTPSFGITADVRHVADALGLPPGAVGGTVVEEVSCGVPYLVVPLRDAATVDRVSADAVSFRRLRKAVGKDLALYLFAPTDPVAPGYGAGVYARMFAPGLGVLEDPATGSAAGPLGAYLVRHRLVPDGGRVLVEITQGVAIGRPSRMQVEVSADGSGTVTKVRVGGQAVLVGRGELIL